MSLSEANELSDRRVQFQKRPFLFARDVLGSKWWSMQTEIANCLVQNRRVAVKSANGVGKTYLAADLTLWFLHSFPGSIVLTTAPTSRQVRGLLWEEIGRRIRKSKIALPGSLTLMKYEVAPGWFAMGLTADSPDSFQGFHAKDLLIVMDEASGIRDDIWDAAEGVAVGTNNRILAIGNPLRASGRFYEIFRGANPWKRITISGMDHPNVLRQKEVIPGAITCKSIEERIKEWCVESKEEGEHLVKSANHFRWNDKVYLPGRDFLARVLGQFPQSDDDALLPLNWIEAAQNRIVPEGGHIIAAVDVARFGSDSTVIGVRKGMRLIHLESIKGADTMAVAGRVAEMAYRFSPTRISIDSIGVGGGVVDRLFEIGLAGVYPVNVAESAIDSERFLNRRAEIFWRLRERFQAGEISILENRELADQLASIHYEFASTGKIKMESKVALRKAGKKSPDMADMLAMLFDPCSEPMIETPELRAWMQQPSPAARLMMEMDMS